MNLTNKQSKVLGELKNKVPIYVFPTEDGECSYGYVKDSPSSRSILYLTLTCRNLLKRDLVMHGLSDGRMVLCLKNLNN